MLFLPLHRRRKVLNIGFGGGGGGEVKNIGGGGGMGGNLFVGCKVIGDSNIKNRIERYTFTNTFK